ncbi:hypothetical protein AFE_0694 [Acidithiobacillus ferrooxidans ATCC 23270]|uniref:Uncharacterized protein n=1 Tax=Acidithiobacillus ferrooxidans (strain ATCC 23270 / DSM 14882 / CIP 104768 / NCIMB 8455) TaxID=243159 RepID=B7J5Z1_ACIF2|nr:hypothetical protein AFE_0694 [Acidithiobacillus ferrooxidans ATCC 23270]
MCHCAPTDFHVFLGKGGMGHHAAMIVLSGPTLHIMFI